MKRHKTPAFALLAGLMLAARAAQGVESGPDLDWLRDGAAPQPQTRRSGADLPPVFRAALPLHETGAVEIADETTELLAVVRAGDLARLKALLKAGAQPNAADRRGERALPLAVRAGRMEIARTLLEQGADPDARGADGTTPLAIVALSGNARIARLLLKAGADPHRRGVDPRQPDRSGYPPRYWALNQGQIESADVLIAHGVRPEELLRAAD
jgi:hypothetical protein